MRDYPITFTRPTLAPARLARITRQIDGLELLIAEAEVPITVGAETFTPLPGCNIDAVEHALGGDMPSSKINGVHSVDGVIDTSELCNGFWDGADVEIYPIDRNNITALGDPLFIGTVEPVAIDVVGGKFSFDLRGLAMQAETLVQNYQAMCRVWVFHPLCGLNPDDYAKTGTIATLPDRFTMTISGMSSPPADGWFDSGTGESETGVKFEIRDYQQSTVRVRTDLPICLSHFAVGQAVTLWPGCDRVFETCADKFSNNLNFQGEPHPDGVKSVAGV